jgi:hypothetical protein
MQAKIIPFKLHRKSNPVTRTGVLDSYSDIAIELIREFFAHERRERMKTLQLIADAPRRAVDAIREEFAQFPDAIEAAAREGERRRRGGQTP